MLEKEREIICSKKERKNYILYYSNKYFTIFRVYTQEIYLFKSILPVHLSYERRQNTTNTNEPRARKGKKEKIAKLCQIGVTGNFATCPCKIYRFIYMLLFGSCRALIPSTIDELFIKWMPLLRCVFRLIVRLFLVCCKRQDTRIKLAQFFRVSSKSMNIKNSWKKKR